MPVTTEFTCANGHKFSAIAKLRARCPSCGVTARRDFSTAIPTPSSGQSKPEASLSSTSPKEDTPTTSASGSKHVTTTKKVARSKSEIKSSAEPKQPISSRPLRVVRQGTARPMKKKVVSAPTKVSVATPRSPTKRARAGVGARPTVRTKLPSGSRERKVVEALTDEGPFWMKVKRQYFR